MNMNDLIAQGEAIYATKYTPPPLPPVKGVMVINDYTEYIKDRDAKTEWEQVCSVFLQTNFPNHPKLSEFDKLCTKAGHVDYRANSCKQQIAILKALATINPTKRALNCHSIPANTSKVFIVHGHDSGTKNEVARFLESLGFTAVILHEQVSQGSTIIEKIERNTDVGFAIVLYTPCDVGAAKAETDKLMNRARQNVVFEHGYLIAKLGRERVCALVKGEIETPGDISGVVYIPKDDGDSWKVQVAKEMKAVEYTVDFNKII